MTKERIETIKNPYIEVANCAGDLAIRTSAELAVKIKGEYQLEEVEAGIVLNAHGDLRLMVPEGSTIKVGSVRGDFLVKGIQGEVVLREINGDAVLANLNQVKVSNVHGDLSVKNLQGPLSVENIFGDAVIRNVDGTISIGIVYGDFAAYYINGTVWLRQGMGDVNLKTINGEVSIEAGHRDVNLRNLGGPCSILDVQGDIRLRGGLGPGEHSFIAMGDIVLRWPVTAPLELVAKAPEISNRLPLEDLKELDDGIVGHLGEGETVVSLTTGGRIVLKEDQPFDEKWEADQQEAFDMDFMIDLANLGERVSAEVNHHMARMTSELETHFGPEFAQNISEKVSQQAEKAARKAEQAAEKAHKYAEREAARAERSRQQRVRYAPSPPRPSKEDEPVGKASSSEQLQILRMVEKGTISPDEASTLLEALG